MQVADYLKINEEILLSVFWQWGQGVYVHTRVVVI